MNRLDKFHRKIIINGDIKKIVVLPKKKEKIDLSKVKIKINQINDK